MTLISDLRARELSTLAAGFLRDTGGAFDGAVLVEPTAEFFPDAVTPSADTVELLFHRVRAYTPLPDDVPYMFRFEDEEAGGGGSCGTGACGVPGGNTYVPLAGRQGEGFVLPVEVKCAGKAEGLMATLSRHAGSLVYGLADTEVAHPDLGECSETMATLSGLGLLLLIGSHVYCKGCSTVRIDCYTALPPHELAWLCAMFMQLHNMPPAKARKHLSGTTRELFDEAVRWWNDRPTLIADLRRRPQDVAMGRTDYSVTRKTLFSKLWGAA